MSNVSFVNSVFSYIKPSKIDNRSANFLPYLANKIHKFIVYLFQCLKHFLSQAHKIIKIWVNYGYNLIREWIHIIAREGMKYGSQFIKIAIRFSSIALHYLKDFVTLYRSQIMLIGGGAVVGSLLTVGLITVFQKAKNTGKS